ncbi:MAG: hypothetical protein AAFX05_09475 [Planctomycetota bacterium]
MAKAGAASGLLTPLGVVAALGVAIGVWLVPGTLLDARSRDGDGDPTDYPKPTLPDPPANPEWTSLEPLLTELRTEIKKPTPVTPPEEQANSGEGGDGGTPAQQPRVLLRWSFDGFILQSGQPAALVTIAGSQRFIFVGETIFDRTVNKDVEVVEITDAKLVVMYDGLEQEIERSAGRSGEPVNIPPRVNSSRSSQ